MNHSEPPHLQFRRVLRVGIDLAALSAAYWLAWLARFDGELPFQILKHAGFGWGYLVGAQYFALWVLRVPRLSWRHVSLIDFKRISAALLSVALVLGLIRSLASPLRDAVPHARYIVVPYGVILINLVFAIGATLGVRILRRLSAEPSGALGPDRPQTPILLVGAGAGGVLLARELLSRPELGRRPVAFLDDDPSKQGEVIMGLPVVGTLEDLVDQVRLLEAKEVLIATPTLPGDRVRTVHRLAAQIGVPAKTIPGLSEIVSGQVAVSRIRNVSVEDLLRREPIFLADENIGRLVGGKRVLITGAGGSIGSELVRQVAASSPSHLILVERAENPLFYLLRELVVAPETRLVPCVGDVTNAARLGQIFAEEKPEVVLHAAAHKHVPLMEASAAEAVRNNVGGTRLVADLSLEHGADVFLLVSTDKAVNPTSVMGASKRVAERYVDLLARDEGPTRFVSVRFGNVLGSNGSVVTIFRDQIAKGGPVTVTDPQMIRYFMTIPEASHLILQAAAIGSGSQLFLLDMGEPVRIVDLAEDMIRLSGLEPGQDIAIEFTGVRPGEKLFEELHRGVEGITPHPTHPKILVVAAEGAALDLPALEALMSAAGSADEETVLELLSALVPEYTRATQAMAAKVPTA
ncbi:MAG: polysaccharide biosynthesis protein [Planctomycetes bacterium]|nr:polysaccharide biosynthesis protein [Planctomycetota bacterium]